MRVRRILAVIALSLLLPAPAGDADESSDNRAELEALLDRLTAQAEKVDSLVLTSKRVKESDLEDHIARAKTMMMRKDGRVLMRTEGRTRVTEKWMNPHQTAITKELMVVDGTYKWSQMELYDEVQVTREKAVPQKPLAALRSACRNEQARILPPEEFLGYKCAVIEVRYVRGKRVTTVTFWVSESLGTILKTLRIDYDGARTEMNALSLEVNPKLDESLFRYTPPKGVKVKDLDKAREQAATRPADRAGEEPADQGS
jgi:hypothetical protein